MIPGPSSTGCSTAHRLADAIRSAPRGDLIREARVILDEHELRERPRAPRRGERPCSARWVDRRLQAPGAAFSAWPAAACGVSGEPRTLAPICLANWGADQAKQQIPPMATPIARPTAVKLHYLTASTPLCRRGDRLKTVGTSNQPSPASTLNFGYRRRGRNSEVTVTNSRGGIHDTSQLARVRCRSAVAVPAGHLSREA